MTVCRKQEAGRGTSKGQPTQDECLHASHLETLALPAVTLSLNLCYVLTARPIPAVITDAAVPEPPGP